MQLAIENNLSEAVSVTFPDEEAAVIVPAGSRLESVAVQPTKKFRDTDIKISTSRGFVWCTFESQTPGHYGRARGSIDEFTDIPLAFSVYPPPNPHPYSILETFEYKTKTAKLLEYVKAQAIPLGLRDYVLRLGSDEVRS